LNCNISFSERKVALSDGSIIPITNFLDLDGDETEELDIVCTIVAGPMPNGRWLAIDVSDIDPDRLIKGKC
jgi:hypothetical protein